MELHWGIFYVETRGCWMIQISFSLLDYLKDYESWDFRCGESLDVLILLRHARECIQKFPDWPLGARTANGTALCH
jgi:hypothetical protein